MKIILNFFIVIFGLSSVCAFSNDFNQKKVSINFVPGTAFLAKVCTKNGCSTEKAVGQSHQDYLNVGDYVCVSVAGAFFKRYEYFFKITNSGESYINFWGPFFYPKYFYDYNFIQYFDYKTNSTNFACSTWDFENNKFVD
ncbi:hypothetical protein [Spirobacillus cienkowskii]|jgi:hypothetical protein|uniref:Uncharacterized protein n=1 Tax=Spirobacillus cienkowskii TaxID=495820 RepID=A0A369KMX7_9BACT|nr:MAG: hypothetical protein DCC88_07265 [Spirobacillus cienkowskii]